MRQASFKYLILFQSLLLNLYFNFRRDNYRKWFVTTLFTPSLFVSLFISTLQYLGHVEVEESRGMHICEDAVKRLKTVGFTRKPLHTYRNPASFYLLIICSSISFPHCATIILLTPSNISLISRQPPLFCP